MILPHKSIQNVRVQVFEEGNSVTISWSFLYPSYDRREKRREKGREERGSLIIQLRIFYDGRIIFSYSDRLTFVLAGPQSESVKVGLANSKKEHLELSHSLEQLERESGVMMIPRTELYQVRLKELQPSQAVPVSPTGQMDVTKIKEINIAVQLPFMIRLFEEPCSFITIERAGILFGGRKPEEGPSENVNYLSVVDINPHRISYGADRINGTPCFSISWWAHYQSRVDCILCQEGRLIFQFVNLTGDSGIFLRVAGSNLTVSLLSSDLTRNIKTNFYQIIFIPRSSCSLPDSCLPSPDCPLLSKLQNCRRFRCLTPSSLSSLSSSCSPPIAGTAGGYEIAAAVSGLLVLTAVLGAITLIRRRNTPLFFLSFPEQGSHQELNTWQETEDSAL